MVMNEAFGVADKTKGLREVDEMIPMRPNENWFKYPSSPPALALHS